jgi:hypothetical protein
LQNFKKYKFKENVLLHIPCFFGKSHQISKKQSKKSHQISMWIFKGVIFLPTLFKLFGGICHHLMLNPSLDAHTQ